MIFKNIEWKLKLLLKTSRISDSRGFGTCCLVLEVLRENIDPTVSLSVHEGIKYIKNMLLMNGVGNASSFRYLKIHS